MKWFQILFEYFELLSDIAFIFSFKFRIWNKIASYSFGLAEKVSSVYRKFIVIGKIIELNI